MAFRVVSDPSPQAGAATGGNAPNQGVTVKAAPPPARTSPVEQAALTPLLERLEALSFTFEALNASSRTYAAEAVLETLGRMERRDLQALAAIEAFASALKTVSQHLAGLRNAIQGTAHDTADGFQQIGQRLDQLEARLGGNALPAPQGGQLAVIAERLGHIEELVGEAAGFDPAPLAHMLDAMAHKVATVEEKIDDLPDRIGAAVGDAVDMAPVTSGLDTIAERMATVERKIDAAKPVDVTPLRLALDVISKRVARIETRMEQAPVAAGFDPAPITQVLDAISSRIASMEERVGSAANVDALSEFLGMVNQRLERMESGLAGPAPLGAAEPEPQAEAEAEPPPEPQQPHPVAQPSVAQSPVAEAPPGNTKQQVDNLLEQVLKVLSR